MKQISDAILLQCLEHLEDGQPIESILARFSEYANELRPILESTRRLQGLSVDPPAAVQRCAKADFLAQAATQAGSIAARWTWPAFRPRWWVAALAFMLLLLFVGATVVPASASAIPGDILYGTKRTVEQWRLLIAASPKEKAQLAASFRQERIREVAQLFGTSRNVQVSFEGTLLSLTDLQWMVEGLPVVVDSTTVIMGSPRVGAEVRVTGRIEAGELLASEISIVGEETDSPLPIFMPTNTLTPTPTASPSSTPTASMTATNTPTLTPTASPSSIPGAIMSTCDDDDCDDDNDSDDDDVDDDDVDDVDDDDDDDVDDDDDDDVDDDD